jgi:hypothetical protein
MRDDGEGVRRQGCSHTRHVLLQDGTMVNGGHQGLQGLSLLLLTHPTCPSPKSCTIGAGTSGEPSFIRLHHSCPRPPGVTHTFAQAHKAYGHTDEQDEQDAQDAHTYTHTHEDAHNYTQQPPPPPPTALRG